LESKGSCLAVEKADMSGVATDPKELFIGKRALDYERDHMGSVCYTQM